MKFAKKTLGIVAFSAALVIPAMGFVAPSQLDKASASDAHLTDEQVFADAYKGLTKSEVSTYVGYLDEKEKVNASIDELLAEDGGKVTDKTSSKYNELVTELDRLDNNLFLLEKKSWIELEKERINAFTNIDEYVRQDLVDNLTVILELETKATNSELTSTEKKDLDNKYREFIATISYFDTVEEVNNANNLTEQEKDKLLDARLKINELNREIANLEYDEYYEIVESDQAKYDEYKAEIDRIYKEIESLQTKAGIETPTEDIVS